MVVKTINLKSYLHTSCIPVSSSGRQDKWGYGQPKWWHCFVGSQAHPKCITSEKFRALPMPNVAVTASCSG